MILTSNGIMSLMPNDVAYKNSDVAVK